MTGRYWYANLADLTRYREFVDSGRLPHEWISKLTPLTRFKDALIMGSRLVKGLDLRALSVRYRLDASCFVRNTIGDLASAGLFELTDTLLVLTPRGRLLSNAIFSRWV